MFESFFSVLFFLVVSPSLASKIHYGKKMNYFWSTSYIIVWRVSMGGLRGRNWFKHSMSYHIQLLFLTSHYIVKSGRHQQWGRVTPKKVPTNTFVTLPNGTDHIFTVFRRIVKISSEQQQQIGLCFKDDLSFEIKIINLIIELTA